MAYYPRILISITGMGDPGSGDTDAWATTLFPDGVVETSGARKWIRRGEDKTFLVEVSYEDLNDAIRAKFERVWDSVLGAGPENLQTVLEEFVGDVATNVLLRDALDGAQRRFVDAYSTALTIAIGEKPKGTDTRRSRIGVLCHSLGTLIGYEGLYAASRAPLITHVSTKLVMCAPMLSAIGAVQSFIDQDRYLTRHGCNKPAQPRTIARCLALYDLSDPFYRIQARNYYTAGERGDLVDEYHEYDSDPGLRRWEAHSMIGSYLQNNRDRIARFLFA